MANKCLVILAVAVCSVAAYWGPDLPPGPYCGKEGQVQCCDHRQDGCSHRILDTLCYCDEFCNRTMSHDDCCPDYLPVCHGGPPNIIEKPSCSLYNRKYNVDELAKQGCNECKCVYDMRSQTAQWQCDQDECIISRDVIDRVRQGASWRPQNYTQLADKKLKDGLKFMLGTMKLTPSTKRMGPIRYDKDIDYPSEFDSRKHWPGFISPIVDQRWCGSDWAVALTGVASDRFAIQSNGAESMLLSPQILLSCNDRGQQGCDGGHVDIAWNFAKNFGLVDEICYPYEARKTKCPFQARSTLREDGCRPSVRQRSNRYRVGPAGRLIKERDIMYDIMSSGPVFAVMTVYQDFFHYRDGIYRHTRFGDTRSSGLHSVRIIGWGQEQGDKYWLVANSWGTEWGENGYFRIARGTGESGIESFVVTALSEVEAYQRK